MDKDLQIKVNRTLKEHNAKRKWLSIVISLCIVVAGVTSYTLINPADTSQQETFCGIEEHKEHSEECYEKVLVCQLPEGGHTHSENCYEEKPVLTCSLSETDGHQHGEGCYETERVLICNDANEEHIHTDECYAEQEILTCQLEEREPHHHDDSCYEMQTVCTCGKEECEPHQHSEECDEINYDHLLCELPIHEHTLQCFSNPDADVETTAVWERMFDRIELSGNWNEDVLAIAQTQLGYTESTANYEVQEDGTTMKGYTRYGDWYGDSYGDWCAMFCSFCLHYAEVDRDLMPIDASCQRWIDKLVTNEFNLYYPAHNEVFADGTKVFEQEEDKYVPVPGDLIFFDLENYDPEHPENRDADHIGFVAELIYDETTDEPVKVKTIEGNSENCVRYNFYEFTDSTILGYGEMPENPDTLIEIVSEPASNGAVVVIKGKLPKNAIAVVEAVTLSEAMLSEYIGVEKAAEIESLVAYDISIFVDGNKWEPTYPLNVEIQNPGFDGDIGEYLTISHVDCDFNEVSEITGVIGENGSICFDTDSFSLFIPLPVETQNDSAPLRNMAKGAVPTSYFNNSWSVLSSPIYSVSGDLLTASPTANDTTTLRGKIDLSLDAGDYAIGDIEIRLPLHVIPSRVEGEWADTIALGLPEYTEGMTLSNDMPFTYTVDDEAGEIVITNSLPITDQISLNAVYSYNFTPTDVVDGTTGCVTAEYLLKTGGGSSDEKSIDYLIDTVVDTADVEKRYMSRYTTWQSMWGDAPADASDMCFLVYNINIFCDKVGGTQASTFQLTETPDTAGTIVFWGYKYFRQNVGALFHSSWDVTGNDVAELNARVVSSEVKDYDETHAYTVVVAYPKSMGVNGTYFSNQASVVQTPVDEIDDPVTYDVSANYTWKTTTFSYSNGISLYKYGKGSSTKLAFETERPNLSSCNKTAVTGTGAATLLMNDIPAILAYRIDTSICSKDGTFKLNPDTGEPLLYQWSSETIDDQLYLNDELLLPGDYRFSTLNVSAQETVWDPNSSSGSVSFSHNAGSPWVYENTDIWYRNSINGEWMQMDDACGCNNSRTKLPDDACQIKVVYTGNSIKVNLNVEVGIEILPSDHVKSLLLEDGTDRIMNVAAMRFINLDGQFCNPQDAATAISGACAEQIAAHDQTGGYGLEPGQALYHKAQTDLLEKLYFTGTLQKRAVSRTNDTLNQKVVINYEVNPTGDVLGYGIGITDYDLAYNLYKNANFRREYAEQFSEKLDNTLKDLTFYDLLPAGMTVDRSTITVTTPSDSTDLIDSLEIVENWRGSGRTMIIAHADASDVCEAYTTGIYVSGAPGTDAKLVISVPVHLKYTAYYSWESIVDYGSSLHNVVALMNNTGDNVNLESGYMDDPNSLSATMMSTDEKAAFTDLNGEPDTCKNTLYAQVTTNLTEETASVSGFQKTVKGENDANYSDQGSAPTGGEYSYRLRYATEDEQSAKDIIFYDVLENAFGDNAHWNGTFAGVDVSQLIQKGVNPVVYYSTQSGINLSSPSMGDADLSNAAIWSITPPSDLSTVTAIAVDARKTTGNTDFVLSPKTSLVAMVQMTAPEDSTGYIVPRVYAYNRAQIQASQKSENEVSWPAMPSLNVSSLTTVHIEDYIDLMIRKVSKEDGSGLPGAMFRLLDSSENVIANGVSGNTGLLTLTGILTGNTYTLEETEAPDGYMPSGPWTVEVNETGVITVTDTSNNEIIADDGVYDIENSKAGVKIILKKTDGTTQIDYGDHDITAIGSPVEGAIFALYETDLSWEDYAYNFTIDKEEVLEHRYISPMEGCGHMVSDADGIFSPEDFTLPFGIYCLIEEQTPTGYLGTAEPIILVVFNIYQDSKYADLTDIEIDQFCDGVDPDTVIWYSQRSGTSLCCIDDVEQSFTVIVKNKAGYELPETGGIGTTLYISCGLVLMTGALMYGCMMRRRRERRSE